IDARPVVTDRPGASVLPPQTPSVEFDDVRFGYVPSQPVLRGLSLRVAPGETLALVGTAGSGKSTISLLLPRFYDVGGGQVRVGGRDVRDLTRDSLRRRSGWCWRTVSCSPTASPPTSLSAGRTRPGSRSWPPPGRPRPTSSSPTCPRGTTPWWASRDSPCPAASGSGSRWPVRCSPTRGSWCWTTPPPR